MSTDEVPAMESADAARRAVIDERLRRGWSRETAARHGGIRGEWWGQYEKGNIDADAQHPKIVTAVQAAFDWPADWPTNPPTDVNLRLAALERHASEHHRYRGEGMEMLRKLVAEVEVLSGRVASLEAGRRGGRATG
jgi:hypothetical protein